MIWEVGRELKERRGTRWCEWKGKKEGVRGERAGLMLKLQISDNEHKLDYQRSTGISADENCRSWRRSARVLPTSTGILLDEEILRDATKMTRVEIVSADVESPSENPLQNIPKPIAQLLHGLTAYYSGQ